MTLAQQICDLIAMNPGLTDREFASLLHGPRKPQQPINRAARELESKGMLVRRRRRDGLIGNYPSSTPIDEAAVSSASPANHDISALSEDDLKAVLVDWLSSQGWSSTIAWGKEQGIDIDARRGNERWIVEVKGPGSRPQMRGNYFLAVLGETLQRMDDEQAKYSISLPDLPQYRGLWERLPNLAKARTGVTMLFVTESGNIEELA